MRFDANDIRRLDAIMTWRRDVRHFKPDPLPEGCLNMLRDAMERAPSVGNSRPWRVMRVRSAQNRAAIRDEFLRSNTAAADSYSGPQRDAYDRLKLAGLDKAPEQLAVFTETDPPEGHRLGRRTMPETLAQSTAMAIHAMWLMARAHNIGVGMVSILRPDRVAALLDAPASWRFNAYLCIGLPETDDDTPLLHRAGWQENTVPPWQDC